MGKSLNAEKLGQALKKNVQTYLNGCEFTDDFTLVVLEVQAKVLEEVSCQIEPHYVINNVYLNPLILETTKWQLLKNCKNISKKLSPI